jgi:gliding motility-associated-like protein
LIQPPEVWVPDAFTVNGDGINENWGTFPLFVRKYSMKVYDRWGKKIWESTAKKQQWDGMYNEKQVPDGVYAWLLTFEGWDNETYQKTGTVLVIH